MPKREIKQVEMYVDLGDLESDSGIEQLGEVFSFIGACMLLVDKEVPKNFRDVKVREVYEALREIRSDRAALAKQNDTLQSTFADLIRARDAALDRVKELEAQKT